MLARQESVALPGPIRLLDGWAATAGNPAGAEAAVVRGGNVDRRNLARLSFLIRARKCMSFLEMDFGRHQITELRDVRLFRTADFDQKTDVAVCFEV